MLAEGSAAGNMAGSNKKNRFKFYFLIFKYWFKSLFRVAVYAPGVHFISAPSGTGKTLLTNIIIQNTTASNQFWYSNIDQFQKDKQVVFDYKNLFDKGKQIAKLPPIINNKYANGIIFDELNANFNRRMNKTNDYNSMFVGLAEMTVTHRHQKMNKLYFLGQSLALQDGQLQHLFKYYHLVFATKKWNYYLYKNNKGMNRTPKKLKIVSYIKTGQISANGMPEFAPFSVKNIKVDTVKHLLTYNHLGYAKKYENMPTAIF